MDFAISHCSEKLDLMSSSGDKHVRALRIQVVYFLISNSTDVNLTFLSGVDKNQVDKVKCWIDSID